MSGIDNQITIVFSILSSTNNTIPTSGNYHMYMYVIRLLYTHSLTYTTIATIIYIYNIYTIHSQNENPILNDSIIKFSPFAVNAYYLFCIGYLNILYFMQNTTQAIEEHYPI